METFWHVWAQPDAKAILGSALFLGWILGIVFMRLMYIGH